MTWKDIRDRKEDSIRESTGNPMVKNPNPFDHNGKTYKSFSDYLNSEEYKEFLRIEEEALKQYSLKAKEYFKSLDMDDQLLVFFHITNVIFENYFNDNGSYRGLLYDKFGFGPEAYSLGCDSGMFTLHNAISTPDQLEERFQNLIKFFKLNLSREQMNSARNYFNYGFDNSEQINKIRNKQLALEFEKDPE
jgi:hypothetical protein